MPIRSVPTRRISLAACLVLSFAWCTHVLGQPMAQTAAEPVHACPALSALPAGHDDASLAAWTAHIGACQRNPAYLAALGRLLVQAGRYAEALDHLERALMLDAEHDKEVLVDYATALAGVGDSISALALLDQLLAEPHVPPRLRLALSRERQALLAGQETGWQHSIGLAARFGHDSNPAGAPDLQALSLTVAGQLVTMALDPSYQSRPGLYARADGWLQLRRMRADGSRWDILASAYTRRSASASAGAAQMLGIQTEYRPSPHGATGANPYWGAALGLLQAQAGARDFMFGAHAGWERPWQAPAWGTCQMRAGSELQQRNHQANALLSGRYAGLSANVLCERKSGLQWLASMRVGLDAARHSERPGGDQYQGSLRLALYLPLGSATDNLQRPAQTHGVLLDAESSFYRDATGYSPLLGNNAVRWLRRHSLRLEYQATPVGATKAWQWAFGLEWLHQRSNLPLFRLQSHGAYVALRTRW